MINRDSELDIVPGIAYRNGAVGTGVCCLAYIVIAFVLQYFAGIDGYMPSHRLLWLGGSMFGVYLFFQQLTLYLVEKDKRKLIWCIAGVVLFVVCAVVFALGMIPSEEV